jgi:hypothetical protein
VHGLMEQEFYHLEPFRGDLQRFLNQAWTYQLWFNYLRENSAKGHRTPDQLRAERAPWVHPKVYALPPVLLSSLSAQDLPSPTQILGQDLLGDVTRTDRAAACPESRPRPVMV